MFSNVTFPVFVTVTLNVTVSPKTYFSPLAGGFITSFSTLNSGCLSSVLTSSLSESVVPSSAVATATFVIVPCKSFSCTTYLYSTDFVSVGSNSSIIFVSLISVIPSNSSSTSISYNVVFPVFVTFTLYVTSSPKTYFFPLSGLLVTSLFTTKLAVSVSSVFVSSSLSPTNATFVIAPLILVTFTENTTVAVVFGATLTEIPDINSSALYVLSPTVTSPFISALFFNIVSKFSSFTVTVPATSPVFSTEIVYVIISPTLATSTCVLSLVITLDLFVVMIAVLVGFPSLLSSPLAIAIFSIVPVASSFTLTLNCSVVVESASISTNHLKDVTFPFSSANVSTSSVLDTYVVPSGIASVT